MEKLELKYLCSYLPYELKILNMGTNIIYPMVSVNRSLSIRYGIEIIDVIETKEYIPIIRPLSDLTKPLKDGTIPILELAKIAKITLPKKYEINSTSIKWKKNSDRHVNFTYQKDVKSFRLYETYMIGDWYEPTLGIQDEIVCNQLLLFKYLFQNHFDTYGLIDSELAIDINTLK